MIMYTSYRRSVPGMLAFALSVSIGSHAPAAEQENITSFRAINSFEANTFAFAPVEAQFVRIAILKTSTAQPCIDELEIYSPNSGKNLGLSSSGPVASASSSLPGYAHHRIEFLNDGHYRNNRSWICGKPTGWCQIKLPAIATINRVVLSRDRNGTLSDRLPVEFDIQVSNDGKAWTTVKKIRPPKALATPSAAIVPDLFQKRETFNDSLIATRNAWQEEPGGKRIISKTPWLISPAIACENVAIPLPQDKAPIPERVAQWEYHPEWGNGVPVPLHMPNRSVVYLYRTITTPTQMGTTVKLGSDDAVIVFLNGKQVFVHDKVGPVRPGEDNLYLNLIAGTNHLMIKLWNISHIAGFCYADDLPTPFAQCRNQLETAFPEETTLLSQKAPGFIDAWLAGETDKAAMHAVTSIFPATSEATTSFKQKLDAAGTNQARQLALVMDAARLAVELSTLGDKLGLINPETLIKAIAAGHNADAGRQEQALLKLKEKLPSIIDGLKQGELSSIDSARETLAFQRELLLSQSTIDFDKILFIRRAPAPRSLIKAGYHDQWGMPVNYAGNSCINPTGWDNELMTLSLRDGKMSTLYRPGTPAIISDVELHFDGDRLLFASADRQHRWQVFEIGTDGTGLRQVSRSEEEGDVDNYDPMYLPDGRIIFNSSATFAGVPCFSGTDYVANLHIMDNDGSKVRRLTYEQDNDWHPTMLADGRVLYLRWEYTDSAHYFSRIMMRMNPDGTDQREFYGSNSYWPNTMFFPKPLPGSLSKFIAVVSGHHGTCRAGELFLFDTAKGRQEDIGVVQRIAPPWATRTTQGEIEDNLVDRSWPKFLHPHPLSDSQFLVAAMLRPGGKWGLYLVDVHGNLVQLAEDARGLAMFEPIPIKKRPTAPVIPDRINPKQKTATVFIQDIYEGPGLRGVPRGTVKKLRVFQYEYSYRDMGGHYRIGMEGPWDVRRLIGTVPVYKDGSASFTVPANTPISIQPLDGNGKAVQIMRSWMVGMPGEVLSCVGCHEPADQALLPKTVMAARKEPLEITPWYGQKRGFSFINEVQPVLERHCVSCHDGTQEGRPDFKTRTRVGRDGQLTGFPKSYMELHPYVYRNGPEGDYHLLTPMEFHANTSEVVQMLRKGHHGVKFDPEGWDRLVTWIDLNVPCYGTWSETQVIPRDYAKRRLDMKRRYAAVDEDVETTLKGDPYDTTPIPIKPEPAVKTPKLKINNWPVDAATAKQQQGAEGKTTMEVDLGNGRAITFVRIPAGEFVMGSSTESHEERPQHVVKIKKAFWMAANEISLADFQTCKPAHRNGFYDQHYKDQVRPGYTMDKPDLPVIRVSWHEAMDFCGWLSKRTGKKATLPTEAQWEYACRAGTSTPLWFGETSTDFAGTANLADVQLKKMAVIGVDPKPVGNPNQYWDFIPKIATVNDGVLHLATVNSYAPNPWGLKNMHGNVAEWCVNTHRAYPYEPSRPGESAEDKTQKVVRGGGWRDRPHRATSSFRLAFSAWQKVYNVGFRPIIVE